MICRGPGFLAVVLFGPSPTLQAPSPLSKLDGRHTKKTEKERRLADGRGGDGLGEEPNYTTVRKPGPLWISQYSLAAIEMKIFVEKIIKVPVEQEYE
jgi:hypothetical protein